MVMRSIVMCASLLCCLPAAAAEVYTWKDKNGNLHYSDTPNSDARPVEVKPGSGDGGAAAEKDRAETARAARCKAETEELDRARKATGLRETDSKGNTRDLTAEERSAYVAGIEKRVSEACGPTAVPPS